MTLSDTHIRQQAFNRLAELERVYGDDIPWSCVQAGFALGSERVMLASRAVGIFRPRQMQYGALSIKTVQPRDGRTNPYQDYEMEEGLFRYSLQGRDADNHHNRMLAESMEGRTPLVYFHAIAPSRYKAIWPCFITDIDRKALYCKVAVSLSADRFLPFLDETGQYRLPPEPERRYAVRETRMRLHQATFRENVLSAYGRRCAMSSLPVETLLDAAHIIPDSHERGVAAVNNGVALSRIHHKAYDADLIGIDPDGRIHISEALMTVQDGPMLEQGLQALHYQRIRLPRLRENHPDREFLARRFESFRNGL